MKKATIKKIVLFSNIGILVIALLSMVLFTSQSLFTGISWGLFIAALPVFILIGSIETMQQSMAGKSINRRVGIYALSAITRVVFPLLICLAAIFYFHINTLGLLVGVTCGMLFSTVLLVLSVRTFLLPNNDDSKK